MKMPQIRWFIVPKWKLLFVYIYLILVRKHWPTLSERYDMNFDEYFFIFIFQSLIEIYHLTFYNIIWYELECPSLRIKWVFFFFFFSWRWICIEQYLQYIFFLVVARNCSVLQIPNNRMPIDRKTASTILFNSEIMWKWFKYIFE